MPKDRDNRKRRVLDQPKEVVQRWVRFKTLKASRVMARIYLRPWLTIKERKRRKELRKTFEEVKKQTIRAERNGFISTLAVFNVALYFLLAERDIQAVKIDALTHPDSWRRNICTRVILLTIYEWDMDKAAGKRLNQALSDLEISSNVRRDVMVALRDVRKVQKKAAKEFSFVRNSTIAHRDGDALVQYRTIRDIHPEQILGLIAEFYEAAHRFLKAYPSLVVESGSLQSLFRQALNTQRE